MSETRTTTAGAFTGNSTESGRSISTRGNIASFTDGLLYEEVRLPQCEYDPDTATFYYLCPCGDVFELTLEKLLKGIVVAECPSCSLKIRIALEPNELDKYNSQK